MTNERLAIVKSAWTKIAGGAQSCSFEALVAKYNAPAHPRVTSREKKAETVFNDFCSCLGARAANGSVSCDDFCAYYTDINAVMPNEKENYFVDMVIKTWGLSSDKAAVSNARRSECIDIIFEKVRQRTHGAEDEGRTVKKIFKHFDLDGFGTIEIGEFRKALETLGCTFPTHETDAVFRSFDKDSNGRLDYEEFSSMFAIRGSGNNPNVNPSFGASREPPNQVLAKIRDTLNARGAHGIRGLGLVFRRMDNNGDKKFDRNEFMWGLRENGHKLSPSEFERIFKYFDKNNDGRITYNEFLAGIRGEMNKRRTGLVMLAFAKLDKNGNGVVELDDIAQAYDVTQHPKFKSGEASKNEVLGEFMSQWDTQRKDSKVTPAEFCEYYADVSASIDEDDYFELMIRNAWHIEGGEGQMENTSIPRELVIDADGTQHVEMMKGSANMKYDANASRFYGGDL